MTKFIGYIFMITGGLICVYGIADLILGVIGYANLTYFLGEFFSQIGYVIVFIVGAIVLGIGVAIADISKPSKRKN
jgi:hypothetical protein